MATIAGFYLKIHNGKLEWLGTKRSDGHPENIDKEILNSESPDEFIKHVKIFLDKNRDDSIFKNENPNNKWNDPEYNDFSYIFENNKVIF